MIVVQEEKVKEWFDKYMKMHSDWTGEYAEFFMKTDSVEHVYKHFMNYVKD